MKTDKKPQITVNEFIALATRASNEIKHLRAQIDKLVPKAQAYDDLSRVLQMTRSGGFASMGEDLTYTLDRRVKELAGPKQQVKHE